MSLFAVAACGPTNRDGGQATDSGDGSHGDGTSTATATTSGAGGTTSSTTGGTGASTGDVCKELVAGEESSSVTVSIHNASDAVVYLPSLSTCGWVPYDLRTDALGPDQSLSGGGCGSACWSKLTEDCNECEDGGACPDLPEVMVLAPGATHETYGWDGRVAERVPIPPQCIVYGHCGTDCMFYVAAPIGIYEFGAIGYPGCDAPAEECDCTPETDGTCSAGYGAAVTGEPIEISVGLDYPATLDVVLTFD